MNRDPLINPSIIECLYYMEKCTLFPKNHQDFSEMSSNFVVALENYPGMTQKSWRVDEMGIHMTLLLWCNMALFTLCRENKQLRVICGEKTIQGEEYAAQGEKKKEERKKWNGLCKKPASLWNYSVMLVDSGWGLPRWMALLCFDCFHAIFGPLSLRNTSKRIP